MRALLVFPIVVALMLLTTHALAVVVGDGLFAVILALFLLIITLAGFTRFRVGKPRSGEIPIQEPAGMIDE